MERTADNRIHTTEWEEVQYKYGNRVGKYATNELNILAQKIADKNQNTCLQSYNPLEEKLLDKQARNASDSENEDEEARPASEHSSTSEEDELMAIRRRRLAELKKQQEVSQFGVLRHVAGADYLKEVTEASEHHWVVALLIIPGQSNSEALLGVMRVVAQRHRDISFVSLISTEAIPNFPAKHVPCALFYKNKTLHDRATGLASWEMKGQLNVHTVESTLQRYNVLPREDAQFDE